MELPKDRNGKEVNVGSHVRLISLSGNWLENLPTDEKTEIHAMIGKIFVVEEIDEYGCPWISRSWNDPDSDECNSHSITLEAHEIELENESDLQ